MNEIEKAIEQMRQAVGACLSGRNNAEDDDSRIYFEGRRSAWSEAADCLNEAYARHKSIIPFRCPACNNAKAVFTGGAAQFEEMQEVNAIPFSELAELANRVAEHTKEYTAVQVRSCHFFHRQERTLDYIFYNNGEKVFTTAQALKAHMEAILNPPEDAGVILEG